MVTSRNLLFDATRTLRLGCLFRNKAERKDNPESDFQIFSSRDDGSSAHEKKSRARPDRRSLPWEGLHVKEPFKIRAGRCHKWWNIF